MKIKISDISTAIKLLSKIPYVPVNEKSKIFFEIDCGKVVDDGTFVVEIKDKTNTYSAAKPGLILSRVPKEKKDGYDLVIDLAYAQIDYAPKFKLESYLDILGVKIPEKHRQILTNFDAYIVPNESILAQFEL